MHSSFLSMRWTSTLGMGKASPQCQTICNRQMNDGNLKSICVFHRQKEWAGSKSSSLQHAVVGYLHNREREKNTHTHTLARTHIARCASHPAPPHPIHSAPFSSAATNIRVQEGEGEGKQGSGDF